MVDDRIPDRLLTEVEKAKRQALRRITRAGEARRKADEARRRAEQEWRDAIVAAHEAGVSSPKIAEHVGLTKQRVLQIIHESREDR